MAITNNGTKNLLPDSQIPSGYVRPTITAVTASDKYTTPVTLTVLKATVENGTKSTTLTNIFDDAGIGLDKQVADIVAADYINTQTVESSAELKSMKLNTNPNNSETEFLSNVVQSYVCEVVIFVDAKP